MPVNSFDDYPMSWRPVLQRTGPLSLELAAQLEADIKSGALLPGTRLPPQRELADFLDVNLSTVSRAFRLCTQKGLLSATVGSGTFVAYDALALSLIHISMRALPAAGGEGAHCLSKHGGKGPFPQKSPLPGICS